MPFLSTFFARPLKTYTTATLFFPSCGRATVAILQLDRYRVGKLLGRANIFMYCSNQKADSGECRSMFLMFKTSERSKDANDSLK